MKTWTDFLAWTESRPGEGRESDHLVLITKQGRFTVKETADGALHINGDEASDCRTHGISLVIHPRSGNDLIVGFERVTN